MDLITREQELLDRLLASAREHFRELQSIEAQYKSDNQAAQQTRDSQIAQIESRNRQQLAATERQFAALRQKSARDFEASHTAIENESHEAYARLKAEIDAAEKQARHNLQEKRWLAQTVFEAKRKQLKQMLAAATEKRQARLAASRSLEQRGVAWLDKLGYSQPAEQTELPAAIEPGDEGLVDWLGAAQTAAASRLSRLEQLPLPKFTRLSSLAPINMLVVGLIGLFTGVATSWRLVPWLSITAIVAVPVTVSLTLWLRALSRRQVRDTYTSLAVAVRDFRLATERIYARKVARFQRERQQNRLKRAAEFQRATQAHTPLLDASRTRRETELPLVTSRAAERLNQIQQQHEQDLAIAQSNRTNELSKIEVEREKELATVENSFRAALDQCQQDHDDRQLERTIAWQNELAYVQSEIEFLNTSLRPQTDSWEEIASEQWRLPGLIPTALRCGSFEVDVPALLREPVPETALPADSATDSADSQRAGLRFVMPAVFDFSRDASLIVRARPGGHSKAVDLFQLIVLRLLTITPPGKLRLTMIDPVGLGQNFATFMHLGDYDEALVGHRIWTETPQIEQKLADVTEHMETVIQKYLRDEFPTIEDYNAQAGEIAEPYRLLVVANYPAGFNESSARRLLSILESGRRCGVHALISIDSRLPAIPGVSTADLEKHATVCVANGEQITWLDGTLERLPFTFDPLPNRDTFKQILRKIGQAAAGARRVEVPFEAIAPSEGQYWRSDSSREIDVPLGRAGATRLQHLRLGQGTSQHVLIAGKTGSGKSTLLHALITNAALRYSPDDLEMYLIDFKKGVEFKTYVTNELPHARVVAIESEREFGVSVMQRLAAEMHQRGETFRAAGVQDIGAFRNAGHPLPRILFIVDEFQEFFVEDDKLAQEAALLLDRLVRQGRAFGIHVHLGSQTLGGAYTLARSTLGQMAVRIALQCSETDAHLILSEENSAARLLSRPGEAIYNDANGLIEGNHPFQVVWLPDDRRDHYLGQIRRLSEHRPAANRPPRIVFEGTRPAAIADSLPLRQLLDGANGLAMPSPPRVWLGEPLAVDEATSFIFERRGGTNLLLLGQDRDLSAGMMMASALSLVAQLESINESAQSGSASIWILDGSGTDSANKTGFGQLAQRLPNRIRIQTAEKTATLMQELSDELQRRQQGASGEPLFLFVNDLARLRELRRGDDDYSFSRSAESKPRPDRQFAEILREGPAQGIHTLVWCDSLTNFNRALERQAIKEFSARVLMQMSATDSSLLIDVPAASQLGRYRALLHREEAGHLEKFRPYNLPSDGWLAWYLDQFTSKSVAKPPAINSLPAGEQVTNC